MFKLLKEKLKIEMSGFKNNVIEKIKKKRKSAIFEGVLLSTPVFLMMIFNDALKSVFYNANMLKGDQLLKFQEQIDGAHNMVFYVSLFLLVSLGAYIFKTLYKVGSVKKRIKKDIEELDREIDIYLNSLESKKIEISKDMLFEKSFSNGFSTEKFYFDPNLLNADKKLLNDLAKCLSEKELTKLLVHKSGNITYGDIILLCNKSREIEGAHYLNIAKSLQKVDVEKTIMDIKGNDEKYKEELLAEKEKNTCC